MKRISVLLLAMLPFSVIVFAQNDDPLTKSINGPVKQITQTMRLGNNNFSLYYGEQPGTMGKTITWYDSISRISEEANYIGDQIQNGMVYQYINDSVCYEYNYNDAGLIDGSYAYIRLDSLGHQVATKRFNKGKFFCADSTVYNERGQIVKLFETPLRKDSLVLSYAYYYDSLGRLSKVVNPFHGTGHTYTIKYDKKGNYIEYHSNKDGKKWERKVFVNEAGQVVRIEAGTMRACYSKFDKYGNWLMAENAVNTQSAFGWATVIIERIIEYYE